MSHYKIALLRCWETWLWGSGVTAYALFIVILQGRSSGPERGGQTLGDGVDRTVSHRVADFYVRSWKWEMM